MAVTGAIFNSLIFGGVDSANYGIYITGEAVYNAPERAVEMVSVPGRNGAIAIDQGRWENIEVEYPAGCFGDGDANFADRISAFRNAVLSQLGYQRLTDTYHPDEFRMAIYVAGLEVEPANINSAGEFKLIFNCKPQRFLTSGETAVAMTSGDSITNPTLYDASPLLEFTGAGSVTINGYGINVQPDSVIGKVDLYDFNDFGYNSQGQLLVVDFDPALFNAGDKITIDSPYGNPLQFSSKLTNKYFFPLGEVWTCSEWSGILANGSESVATLTSDGGGVSLRVLASDASYSFTVGTASNYMGSVKWSIPLIYNGTKTTYTITQTCSFSYDGDTEITVASILSPTAMQYGISFLGAELTGVSSVPTHSMVKYVDFEIGEAYTIEGDTLIPINDLFEIGSSLAVLSSGENIVTYSSNIDDVKITPRWWQL